jgi:flagellar biosynthesis/type III secretory pathway chaperone
LTTTQAALETTLDAYIEVMRALVECSQHEQQHLLAFEIGDLQSCLARKRTLVDQIATIDAQMRRDTETLRSVLDVDHGQASTIKSLVQHIPEGMRESTETRRVALRALAQSLEELQRISLVHADRGLKTVRAYASLLSSHGQAPSGETYTQTGQSRRAASQPGVLSRSV